MTKTKAISVVEYPEPDDEFEDGDIDYAGLEMFVRSVERYPYNSDRAKKETLDQLKERMREALTATETAAKVIRESCELLQGA
jgi:hypothetical protein